jgi:DNA repair protein RadD
MNSAPVLRPYQSKVLDDINNALLAGHRRLLIVAPTGSGKTVKFAEFIRREVAKRGKLLVISHRREIVHQTSGKLTANGVVHGIIMAGEQSRPLLDVQVASIQTLFARGIRREVMALPPADFIIIDEAHHVVTETYRKIIEAYPDAICLGFTATPERGDGRGLGGFFDVLIESPQVAELKNLGFLVGTRVYAPYNPDLTGVQTRGGDYVAGQLAERMNRVKLVGDIVEHWLKFGEGHLHGRRQGRGDWHLE